MVLVTGDKALDKALSNLKDSAVKKIMRPAISAGLRVSAKAMKAAVPARLKDAKKAIGSRFSKSKRNGELMAKAGAGVGMKAAKINKQAAAQKQKRAGRPGIGIGARNIMWWILGTADRFTGSKRIRSKKAIAAASLREPTGGRVHPTGSMKPQMNPVKQGFQASESATMAKIVEVAKDKLAQTAKP